MKRHALTVILVGAIVLLMAALAPPGGAAAQGPQPTMVLSPSSGPCDATVEVTGTGFLGESSLRFYLVQPGTSDISADFLNSTYVNGGTFRQLVFLDKRSCDAAALDSQSEQPTGNLTFAFTAAFTEEEWPVQPGERIPDVIAVAQYAYTTTTTLKPQPTMTITPSSGPCDGSVEITGTNFFDQPGVRFYVLQPGTEDISMGLLNSGVRTQNGNFSQSVWLHEWSCEAAALDSQLEHPTGHLLIAASFTFKLDAKEGERISNIVAVAEYAYTTTVAQPGPTLVLSPSSGPCDATVEITGRDFPADAAIRMDMGVPNGDGSMGKFAALMADSSGRFVVTVDLGALGCRAATLDDHYSGQLWLFADLEERVIEPGQGMPPILTRSPYTYTTMQVGAGTLPNALPTTGGGPGDPPVPLVWFAVAGALGSAGLVLVMASLYRAKRHG